MTSISQIILKHYYRNTAKKAKDPFDPFTDYGELNGGCHNRKTKI